MAKAINWPVQYRNLVLEEPSNTPRLAIRLGRLYFDTTYWVPDEVVDIRVNSFRVRRGKVLGNLRLCQLKELTPADFALLKPDLNTLEAVLAFLGQTYATPVNEETEVTLVTYINFPVDPELLEKPLR